MGVEDNKDIVRKMLTSGSILDYVAEDIRWTIIGTTTFSGTMEGKRDVIKRLFGPLTDLLETLGSNVIDNMIGEGDLVVVQFHATDRMTKTGKPYNNTYCMVVRVVDGKAAEIFEYADTELATAAFGPA